MLFRGKDRVTKSEVHGEYINKVTNSSHTPPNTDLFHEWLLHGVKGIIVLALPRNQRALQCNL